MARHSVEPDMGITLMVSTTLPPKTSVKDELTQIVRSARGDDKAIVRVFMLLAAPKPRLE